MNNQARKSLSDLLRIHGKDLCNEPRRLRALLNDACPSLKREAHILATAAEFGIPADLARSADGLPWPARANRLMKRLMDDAAMEANSSRWAVESWGKDK